MNNIDIALEYQKKSKNTTSSKHGVPFDSSLWPDSWKTVIYKEYKRLSNIDLGLFDYSLKSFIDVLKGRHSARIFEKKKITLKMLSDFLGSSFGVVQSEFSNKQSTRRTYPSGGGLFPNEVYILVRYSDELPAGWYHYNFKKHSLELIRSEFVDDSQIIKILKFPWTVGVPAVIFISSVYERNWQKYKDRAYRYQLIEAGHMGQNAYLVAESLGMGCCALGSCCEEIVEDKLYLDGVSEFVVYTLAIGN